MSDVKTTLGSLLLVGVNHTTAPLDVRERLAIETSRLADATRTLAHQPGIREAMILSTCNRVELLTVADETGSSALDNSHTLTFLRDYLNIRTADLQPHLYEFREREAVRHLFRVACSLDSMIVGEPQILGQVKQAWSVAHEVGAVKQTLDPLLQRAFSVAKRVRTETQIGSSQVSVASIAAELARKIFGSLSGKTVLLVGAGKMSDLAARHLIQQGCTTLLVSNRTEARAEKIADALRTPAITYGRHPFRATARAVSPRPTSSSPPPAPDKSSPPDHARSLQHRRRNRPVFFIDIAVPRDVAPEVNAVEGCFVYDIDDLQQAAQENRAPAAARPKPPSPSSHSKSTATTSASRKHPPTKPSSSFSPKPSSPAKPNSPKRLRASPSPSPTSNARRWSNSPASSRTSSSTRKSWPSATPPSSGTSPRIDEGSAYSGSHGRCSPSALKPESTSPQPTTTQFVISK